MILIAHRGSSGRAPENTAAAFRAALDDEADAIETDVRLTADGVAVLSHDDRTPVGLISTLSWADLSGAVIRLEELIEIAGGRVPLYLELKPWLAGGEFRSAGVVARTIAPVVGSLAGVTISSFDPGAVVVAREVLPGAATALGVLEGVDPSWAIDAASSAGHAELHLPDATVDGAVLERVRAAGLRAAVFTVNDARRMVELETLGADAIFTDVPRAARNALSGHR